jgi:MFS family permease
MENFFKKNLEFLKTHKLIRNLIFTNFIFWGGWSLINPIFSVFIVQKIENANVATAGVAVAIFSITFSIFRFLSASFLDSKKGQEDEFWSLFYGLLFLSFCSFLYLFVRNFLHLFFLQFFQGIAMAMYYAGYYGIYLRSLPKEKEGTAYSFDISVVNFIGGLAVLFGGTIAYTFGFKTVFVLVGIFTFLSAIFSLRILREISPHSFKKIKFFPF